MPLRAISIIPLLTAAPNITPTAATAKIYFTFAALAPTAGPRKFTASLLTPTIRSNTAKIKRKTMIPK